MKTFWKTSSSSRNSRTDCSKRAADEHGWTQIRNKAVIRVHLCPSVAQIEFFRILQLISKGWTWALGNLLRHEHDRVDASRVWAMIEDDLDPLRAGTQRALERLRTSGE
jgi:hypothetical protein